MKRINDLIRERLFLACGIINSRAGDASFEELRCSEWSPQFEDHMRCRLVIGSMRYGRLNDPEKPNYDYVGSIIDRAKMFRKTGNCELLVDIANLALLEFEDGNHPLKHFESSDDGKHVGVKS